MGWEVLVSTAGGAFATCLGVFAGGLLSRRNQDRQWLRDARAEAYRTLLLNYARVEMELRAAHFERRDATVDWSAWSASIMAVSLVADPEVEETLMSFGLEVGTFAKSIEENRLPTQDQLTEASQDVGRAQLRFVNAARASLSADQKPLAAWLGGPDRPRAAGDAAASQP